MNKWHVLWSGGEEAKIAAMEFALSNYMTTLEMSYPWLEQWAEDMAGMDYNEYVQPAFDNMSAFFVESIPEEQTEVFVFICRKRYKERRSFHYRDSKAILHNTEHPRLKRMNKIIHVIFV